jgi:hypothetical protein
VSGIQYCRFASVGSHVPFGTRSDTRVVELPWDLRSRVLSSWGLQDGENGYKGRLLGGSHTNLERLNEGSTEYHGLLCKPQSGPVDCGPDGVGTFGQQSEPWNLCIAMNHRIVVVWVDWGAVCLFLLERIFNTILLVDVPCYLC